MKKAEKTAVSLAVSRNQTARFMAGNLQAEKTPDQPVPDPEPNVPRETTGSLEAAALQKIFRNHSGQAQKCYERALKLDQSLAGRVVLMLTIGRDGSVLAASAQGDTLRSNAVNNCLEQQARGWTFPKPTGGAAKVRKPYTFSPKR